MLVYPFLTFYGEIDTFYVSRRVSEYAKRLFLVIVKFVLDGLLTRLKISDKK
jgi:hypothetical protein